MSPANSEGNESSGKSQHYIPRVYLKRFVDTKGLLWVLEQGKKPRASVPKDEAHREDFYTFHLNGKRDETAEKILGTIESRVAPILTALVHPQFQITAEHIGSLYLFVALMFVRVPAWREFLDKSAAQIARNMGLDRAVNAEQFYSDFVESQRLAGKNLDIGQKSRAEAEKLRSFVLSGKYEIEQKSVGFNLGMMFLSMFDLAEELSKFGFHILLAPQTGDKKIDNHIPPESRAFITCDNPVFTVRPDRVGRAAAGVGFGWPGTEVYMPIGKRCCLRLAKGLEPAHAYVTQKFIRQINMMIMASASKFAYSSIGEKRLGRLFDESGCKLKVGENTFIPGPALP